MPEEIDILGRSSDVVKLGNLLKTASIHFPNLEAREAEVSTLPWTQTEKDIALARCKSGQRAWRNKNPVVTLSAVTDEEDHSLENEDESGRRLCEYCGTIFQAREERQGITNMKIFCDLFNKPLITSVGLLIRLSLMTSLL